MATPKAPPSSLTLTIRFASSLPDLSLTVPSPPTTSLATVTTLIRSRLPPPLHASTIRLIHAGRVLPPTDSLTSALRLPGPASQPTKTPEPAPAIYIHASLSTPLAGPALAAEAALALSTDAALAHAHTHPAPPSTDARSAEPGSASSSSPPAHRTTTVAPTGFDRLAAAGLTGAEIAALRSQFRAIVAHTHTAETMPTGGELRALEERWLEGGADGGGAAGAGGDEDVAEALGDILWGNVVGFFWPVGALVWGVREEGLWTRRRRYAVVTGFLVNLGISVLRVTG